MYINYYGQVKKDLIQGRGRLTGFDDVRTACQTDEPTCLAACMWHSSFDCSQSWICPSKLKLLSPHSSNHTLAVALRPLLLYSSSSSQYWTWMHNKNPMQELLERRCWLSLPNWSSWGLGLSIPETQPNILAPECFPQACNHFDSHPICFYATTTTSHLSKNHAWQ